MTEVDSNTQSDGHVPRTKEEEMRRVIFHEVIHFEVWHVGDISKPQSPKIICIFVSLLDLEDLRFSTLSTSTAGLPE